jgi:hypothetical protein
MRRNGGRGGGGGRGGSRQAAACRGCGVPAVPSGGRAGNGWQRASRAARQRLVEAVVPASGGGRGVIVPTSGGGRGVIVPASGGGCGVIVPASGGGRHCASIWRRAWRGRGLERASSRQRLAEGILGSTGSRSCRRPEPRSGMMMGRRSLEPAASAGPGCDGWQRLLRRVWLRCQRMRAHWHQMIAKSFSMIGVIAFGSSEWDWREMIARTPPCESKGAAPCVHGDAPRTPLRARAPSRSLPGALHWA